MKKIFFINLFAGLLLFNGIVLSQELRIDTIEFKESRTIEIVTVQSVPKFILQFNTGFSFGIMELNGHNGGFSKNDFIYGKTYGSRNAISNELIFKIPLHKKGNFWFDVLAGYNRFQSDLIANNTKEGRVHYNHLNFGLGAEYNFTPSHKVKYYIGLSSLFNIISGEASLANTDTVNVTYYDVLIKPSFRIGYSLFTGFNYGLSRDIGFNLGIKYNHANLLLKNTDDKTTISETYLNDESVEPRLMYSGWKQFAYITIHTGLSYYFGVREKRYKLR